MLSPGALLRPGTPGPPGPSRRTDRFDHGFRTAAPARKAASVHQVFPRLYFVPHRHLGTGAGRRRLPRATSLRAAPPACWQGVTVVYAPSCPLRSQASRRWSRAAFFCLLRCISSGYAWTVAWAPARLTSLPPVPSPGAFRLCDLRPLGFLRQAAFAPPVGASPGFWPTLSGCSSSAARSCCACSCRCFAPSSSRPHAPAWSSDPRRLAAPLAPPLVLDLRPLCLRSRAPRGAAAGCASSDASLPGLTASEPRSRRSS